MFCYFLSTFVLASPCLNSSHSGHLRVQLPQLCTALKYYLKRSLSPLLALNSQVCSHILAPWPLYFDTNFENLLIFNLPQTLRFLIASALTYKLTLTWGDSIITLSLSTHKYCSSHSFRYFLFLCSDTFYFSALYSPQRNLSSIFCQICFEVYYHFYVLVQIMFSKTYFPFLACKNSTNFGWLISSDLTKCILII